MKSYIPYAEATLRICARNPERRDLASGITHALTVLGLVGDLVATATEDGAYDPRRVKDFLDRLHVSITGKERGSLRTAVPVEEWDRGAEEAYERAVSARPVSIASSLGSA